jgi:predicted O-methyltransferase YrrM
MDTVKLLTEKAPEKFDVIIEDGPHNLQSQLFAVEHYYPLLKPGGTLIIEDIQDSAHLKILTNAVSSDALTVNIFDVRHTKGRYDDLIWTVTKQ